MLCVVVVFASTSFETKLKIEFQSLFLITNSDIALEMGSEAFARYFWKYVSLISE